MFGLKKLFTLGENIVFNCFPRRNVIHYSLMPSRCLLNMNVFTNGEIVSRSFANRKKTNDHQLGRLVNLRYQVYDQEIDETKSENPVVILHGILGSKENWTTMAKEINKTTGRQVWTVDARNHGDSPHSQHFSYEFMSCDLILFMRTQKISKATFIGHNIGGRVIMMVAMRYPQLIQSMIIVEISPVGNSPKLAKQVPQLLKDLKNLELDQHYTVEEARHRAAVQLKEKKYDKKTIAFLLTNLVPTDFNTNWRWKFNLDVINKEFEREIVFFPIVNAPCHTRTLFLGGAKSDYLIHQEEEEIKDVFTHAKFTYIQGAGHWIHEDKPAEFINVVTDFIDKDPTRIQEDLEKHPLGFPVKLKFQKYRTYRDIYKPDVPIIILHGLLGSRQNWHTIAGQLNKRLGRKVYTLDARNHGESPHSELFTYELMVSDVIVFMNDHQITKATLIGHSMGGRTAMRLSMMYPILVQSLVVVDISPFGVSPSMLRIKQLLKDLQELKLDRSLSVQEARKQATAQLKDKVDDESIIPFILTNLVENTRKPGWRWRFNLDSIAKHFDKEVAEFQIMKSPCKSRILFLGGGISDYLHPKRCVNIKRAFPNARFSWISGAGHWVHAEKPAEFLDHVTEFIGQDNFLDD